MFPAPPDTSPDRPTPAIVEQPAGIYVHIPFCRTKCPYCSFVSYPGLSQATQSSYLEMLLKQARKMADHPWIESRKFYSLFVGGGTPSSLDPEKLARFIAACLEWFDFEAGDNSSPEVTVEANPNTASLELLQRLRQAGVNRLSLGVQSFSDPMLKNIGRSHTVRDNLRAFSRARKAGFDNISLDLMYGLPGQDEAVWEDTLLQATALSPEHMSVYELTVEPGTPFAAREATGRLNLPPEEAVLAMSVLTRKLLTAKGYPQYEISNYCRSGFTCRHNVNYWENGSYLGLGAGAVSCFSGVRIKSIDDPVRYAELLDRDLAPFAEAEFLPLEARFRETVVMGLRLTAGVSIKSLRDRFGLTPQEYYGEIIANLGRDRLLATAGGRLKLTRKGLRLANLVMAQLV